MTATITPVIANTSSFGDWLFKTNEVINFVSNNVPSTLNPVSGDIVIDGALETTDFFATTIYGGEISTPGDLELASNTVFSANVSFTGNTVNMGTPARYIVSGSNTTHFILAANTSTGRLRLVDGSALSNLDADKITTGTLNVNRIPNLDASKITTGTISVSRLGSGTANTSTFLRGDNTWERVEAFPTGTRLLFQQTTAPIGWTKVTDSVVNNKALRVVTGTAGGGGTQNFTTAFATGRATTSAGDHSHTITVSNHTLTTAQIPSHTHTFSATSSAAGSHSHAGSTGTAGSHNHTGVTSTAGDHNHTIPIVTGALGDGQIGVNGIGIDGAGSITTTVASGSAGSHSHSLSINAAGDHAHTLSINAVGDHSHSISGTTGAAGSGSGHNHAASSNSTGAHTHILNMDVAYIDLIIATKN
jgi:microcystin-dependent protein